MADLIRTIHFYSEGSTAAVVRLPTHGHEWITWALDAGAAAIVLPHVRRCYLQWWMLLTLKCVGRPRALSRLG
jgi:hypothetical protein